MHSCFPVSKGATWQKRLKKKKKKRKKRSALTGSGWPGLFFHSQVILNEPIKLVRHVLLFRVPSPSSTKLIKNGVFCLTRPVPVTVLTLFGWPGCCQQDWVQQRDYWKGRLISTLQNNTREQSRSCLLKHIREVDSPPEALLSQTRRPLSDHREKNASGVILIKW